MLCCEMVSVKTLPDHTESVEVSVKTLLKEGLPTVIEVA